MAKIIKAKQANFTVLDNGIIRDDSLSWKARGIFAYLYSQSEEWSFYETEVKKHSTDGLASLKSGLKELEEKGYLRRVRNRDEQGRLKNADWIISDSPMFDFPTLDKPTLDKPMLDNRTLRSTNTRNTNNKNTNSKKTNGDSDIFEECWEMYPRKKGSKESAKRSFNKAIKSGVTVELIKSKIEEYKQEIAYKHTQEQYIKHGSTWFNQAGWQDEYETGNKPQKDLSKMTREQQLIEVMGKDGVRF